MSTLGWIHMIFGLVALLAGTAVILIRKGTRRPKGRRLELHAAFISGSFVGLVAATAAEVTSRIPGTEAMFGLVVGVTSALVIGIGAALIHRHLPQSINRTPARFRRAS